MKRSSIAVLTLLSALLTAGSAYAADSDEALAHFERGRKLYENGAYPAAQIEFMRAHSISNNYKLLYNIGLAASEAKDYAAALDAFNAYLRDGGTELKEDRRADVRDRIAQLSMFVTTIRVECDVAGAEISIDDRVVGVAPIATDLTVKTGRSRVVASYQGRSTSKLVDASAGEHPTVSLVLGAPSSSVAVVVPPPIPVKPEEPPSFPVVPWIVTGALGGGAAVVGVLAVGARDQHQDKKATFGVTRAELESADTKARTLSYVTDGLLVGTVLFAGLSTYLTVRYYKHRKRVDVSVSPTGFSLSGAF
jgi:hypothetical protein